MNNSSPLQGTAVGEADDFTLWASFDKGKGIYGHLDAEGAVAFCIEAGEDSPIRGTELFNRLMAFFGERVRAIRGVWRKGEDGAPSTNIDKVNELTGLGVPLEDAILQAWTVTRAKKLGFTKVSLSAPPEGRPGAFTKIHVLIEK